MLRKADEELGFSKKSKPTFLLYYRIITKEYPMVQFVTSDVESCMEQWKQAKKDEWTEKTVTDVFVEVWKDEKYLSRILWTDESEYHILEHLASYF